MIFAYFLKDKSLELDPRVLGLLADLGAQGFDVYPVRTKEDVREGTEMLLSFGGDGTLNETISGFMQADSKLPLGYIPAGSTNDFASSMKLSSVPKIAAKTVAKGDINLIDVGRFNNERYFTYVACFGAFTASSYSVSQDIKNVLGHFAYVLGSIKEIGAIKSYNLTIEMDNITVSGEYIFVSATNSTSVAGIVKLRDELVDMGDGVFEIALVKKPKNLVELNKIVTAITTSNFDNGQIEFYKSSKVNLTYDGKLDWSLDGEHAESNGNVTIENVHHGIKFIR
jgi:YegS/Rv2252/BmrU family lipid kinase